MGGFDSGHLGMLKKLQHTADADSAICTASRNQMGAAQAQMLGIGGPAEMIGQLAQGMPDNDWQDNVLSRVVNRVSCCMSSP